MKPFLTKFLFFCTLLTLVTCVKEEPQIYGSISGVVKDSDTKKPIPEVTVQLQPGGVSHMTGDDGAFNFVELEPGTYKVLFKRDSYEDYEQSVVVKAQVESSIQISLDPIVPELKVSTNTLDFGKEIQTLSFDITNKGKGKLTWSISHEIEWLKCEPVSGEVTKEQQTVSIAVDRSKLESGSYVGSLVVASNGGSQTILVSCINNKVNLEVEPSELDFGSLTNSLQLTLKNVGKGTLHYTASTANQWVTLEKTAGNVTELEYINVIVSREGLSAGNYTSLVLLTVDSGSVSVPVKMSVSVNEKPTVTVEDATDITFNSVTLHGTIVSPGSAGIKRYGFCWKEGDGEPTVQDNFSNLGDCTKPQAFESFLTNLKSDCSYSYRAYAENNVGLVYSEQTKHFATLPLPTTPTVQTGAVAESGATSVIVNGTIGSLGNVDKITHYGHVWSMNDNPTLESGNYTDLGERNQTGTYTSTISELESYTAYYYRAYATNEKGTAYGETRTFTTAKGDAVVVTTEPTDIIHNAATVGGDITDTGGNEITEKGVCWGTSPLPNIDGTHVTAQTASSAPSSIKSAVNKRAASVAKAVGIKAPKVTQAIPGGTFSCRIEGLEKQTSYYVRAYIRTADGNIFYGSDKRFTTTQEATLPSVSEVIVSNVLPTAADLKATIISNGNAEITSCGFCYNTIGEPTVDDQFIACQPSGISLITTLSNLAQNTTYYVRAYAINSLGISYSPATMQFATGAYSAPQLSSVIVDNIGRTSATASSSIISDGYSAITECGIVWSTNAYPTTTDNMGKYTLSTTNFSTKLTGLPEQSTIHVRAYAINNSGAGYSDDLSFETIDVDNDIWDGSVATKFGGGMSTESDPILITSADQFALLARNVNNGTSYNGAYFKLMTNISLHNISWTPIGYNTNTFAGNFDGNGMVITGLNNTKGMGGLFGNNSGTIKNLKVYGMSSGSDNVGGIAATNSGLIDNCVNCVSVTATGIAGGIVGTSTGSINNCKNQGVVNSTGEKVGGIAGYAERGPYLNNKNAANISGLDYAGGILGSYSLRQRGNVLRVIGNNLNSGHITASSGQNGAGGIVGFAKVTNIETSNIKETVELTIINCCNIGDINALVAGGICGAAELSGTKYRYHQSNMDEEGKLSIKNCISEQRGLIEKYTKIQYIWQDDNRYEVSATLEYPHSFWLYDIVNNIGQETGVGTDNYIDAWYLHDASGCYLKDTHEDIVTLLNDWVNTNGALEYKKWKYITVDGFAVPVFDEE